MRRKDSCQSSKGSAELKIDLAEMLKGGVIMEVINPEQAKIAEDCGAVAVVAIEKNASEIKAGGGIARMSNPEHIQRIQEAVSIPIIAKCRIGHVVEAQILESLFVDYVDESESLTAVDEQFYIDKQAFRSPFVCGYANLEEALARITEGAAMVRTKVCSGQLSETVRCLRNLTSEIRRLTVMTRAELYQEAHRLRTSFELLEKIAQTGALPVPNFACGDITNPADAALMFHLGAESLFVGAELFKTKDHLHHIKAIIGAASFCRDPEMLANISKGVLEPMRGAENHDREEEDLLTQRGW